MGKTPMSPQIRPSMTATADAEFPWFTAAMLAMEAGEVIRLRLEKFARGEADAVEEAELMVSEKMAAALEATARLMAGASPAAIVDLYRNYVAANAERLVT
ncbi:hypothetical protein HL667_04825 [Bradyrhizobium sp. 83012]|uniref:Uncharacterized protein n=2 Tax=Bradyrhizobium aeschynomenes TaxID=2734909 RepID=A0ABX2CAR3_9BRAD|nr:hypothetical protein [Bradyrhizobium aeschynomenes]NPV21372.1 hypothetical protein [Bradyrhizobium aeschynomenes]